MKKRKLIIALATSALFAVVISMRIKGITSSSVERGFTRRYRYLLQQPSHFRKYKFNCKLCCESLEKETECKPKACCNCCDKQIEKKNFYKKQKHPKPQKARCLCY